MTDQKQPLTKKTVKDIGAQGKGTAMQVARYLAIDENAARRIYPHLKHAMLTGKIDTIYQLGDELIRVRQAEAYLRGVKWRKKSLKKTVGD